MMGSTHSNPEYYTQNIVLTFHNRWYCMWMNILLQWWVFYI
jgi:hypothetical protein